MFTSYRQKLASFKRFSGIQRNFAEIGFRCLVLLEKISFDKIFEAVTQKLAIVNDFGVHNFVQQLLEVLADSVLTF